MSVVRKIVGILLRVYVERPGIFFPGTTGQVGVDRKAAIAIVVQGHHAGRFAGNQPEKKSWQTCQLRQFFGAGIAQEKQALRNPFPENIRLGSMV